MELETLIPCSFSCVKRVQSSSLVEQGEKTVRLQATAPAKSLILYWLKILKFKDLTEENIVGQCYFIKDMFTMKRIDNEWFFCGVPFLFSVGSDRQSEKLTYLTQANKRFNIFEATSYPTGMFAAGMILQSTVVRAGAGLKIPDPHSTL